MVDDQRFTYEVREVVPLTDKPPGIHDDGREPALPDMFHAAEIIACTRANVKAPYALPLEGAGRMA